jgi:hypothetical protein
MPKSQKYFKKGVIVVIKAQIFVYALKIKLKLIKQTLSALSLVVPYPLPKSLKIYKINLKEKLRLII